MAKCQVSSGLRSSFKDIFMGCEGFGVSMIELQPALAARMW
jgi:hypothetical protein